jgi:flagellar biosynthetic protein FliR
VGSFFVTLPFTSYRGVPNLVKVFLALVVSYLIFLSSDFSYAAGDSFTTMRMVLFLGGETLTGLTIGFIVLLFFTAFRMAGQLADVTIGLSMAGIFDPQFGSSVTLLSQFYYLFAMVIYFTLNGHHYLFLALARSFELIPLGGLSFNDVTVRMLLELFYYIWAMSFQIAAPIVAAILITDIALGLISETVPQLHVFLEGLTLKVFVGLFVVYLTLPFMSLVMEEIFGSLYTNIINIMESMT